MIRRLTLALYTFSRSFSPTSNHPKNVRYTVGVDIAPEPPSMTIVEYTNCDHVCPVHPKVTIKIIGGMPKHKPTPETDKAFAPVRKAIEEMRKAAAEFKRNH